MNESILTMIGICVVIAINIGLIFMTAFLFATVHRLRSQLKRDEALFDKYSELVKSISDGFKLIERDVEANTRTIEYVGNVNDKRNKDIIESLVAKEKALYESLASLREWIFEDINTGEPSPIDIVNTKAVYQWQYCNDPDREKPVVGESYIIVGRVKGATAIEVENENGHYGDTGKFYKTDGTPFEKVFAYIRMPKASDIQDRLFALIKEDPLSCR